MLQRHLASAARKRLHVQPTHWVLSHAWPPRPATTSLPSSSPRPTRLISTTSRQHAPNYPPRPPPPGGGQGGGFPIGNIFGQQQQREPGAALKEHGVDLTALAKEGKLDPVIGRDEEIKRTLQILSRRTKNNPVLIGPAGVGKTAIVEGIAQRLVAGEVPESLKDRRIISLDLGSIMGGTAVRGSFEEKIKNLINDIQDEKDKAIIFIDEIHQLLGLGKAEGSLDAGNMLKPALARGLQLAGATTVDEYRRTIEKDAALTRRFQPVLVEEPTVEQTITMLRGLKHKYEIHHSVAVSDAALVTAAVAGNRYITERNLPDSAIDLVDEACATVRLARESKPDELEALQRHITELQIELSSLGKDQDDASKSRREVIESQVKDLESKAQSMESTWRQERSKSQEIQQAREELEKRRFELDEAQRQGKFDEASRLRYETIPNLERKIPDDGEGTDAGRVTSADVAKVVAKATGIPVSTLLRGDRARLLQLEDILRQRVVGQDPAISAVAEAIRLSRAGLHSAKRPIASFLYLGCTGTGKTELARALAVELTGQEKNLITINMSEFHDKHTVSRLIGAPPGYVGFESAGMLTEAVRRHPYSVILFDEFEKAAPEVANILLQILDEGTLTDSQGRKVDFKNTVIVLTSNIGSDILMHDDSIRSDGTVTDTAKEAVLERVRSLYPPELLNRLDEQVVFNSLSPQSIANIVTLRLKEVQQALNTSERRVELLVEQGARDWLAQHGYEPRWGARALNRLIAKQVRQPLASALLKGTIRDGDVARVRLNDKGNALEVVPIHEPELVEQGQLEVAE
ncbi:chaperone ATPase hsp78 [Microbotryomycetes sp. JL221]|nr:chaperone ATPase hsp78 [Microbotryomycetes sp. JL221]